MVYEQHLFLPVLEAGKSKIKVPRDSRSGKAWFLVFVPSCCVLAWWELSSEAFSMSYHTSLLRAPSMKEEENLLKRDAHPGVRMDG